MPHLLEHINAVAVTREELIPKYWNNWEHLRKELTRYKDKPYGIKRCQHGGGRGRNVLIDFDSLPKNIQEELGDPRKVGNILERYYQRDGRAYRFYQDFEYPDGSTLLPNTIEQYTVNASVMNALYELKEARLNEWQRMGRTSKKGLITSLMEDAENFKETMRVKYGYEHNIPTSRRFKDAFEKYGAEKYQSLIKDINKKSSKNRLKMTDETRSLLDSMFATQSHKPTVTEVTDQYEAFLSGYIELINQATGEVYNPKDYPTLSESSVRNYLNQWESKIGTYAKRSGDRQKLMTQFSPYHSFEIPQFAGSIISVDDRQPPFEYAKGKRMWFYNGIDLASECFTTFVYGKSKEGIILDFYRQMVRNYHAWGFNIPAEIEGEISLNHHYQKSFLKDGVMFEKVNLHANSARSKKIESYYKPLRYNLEKKEEGWIARPFAISESNQKSNEKVPLVPYNELSEMCVRTLFKWNNMEHSKIKGKTRWEVFCENQNPDLLPTNYKGIIRHLGYKTESSCNAGITKLNYGEVLLAENGEIVIGEDLIRLMKKVEGKDFDIYWLDTNDGKILKAFIYMDDQYICELMPKPKPNKAFKERTAQDDEMMELMSKYANTVNAFQRIQKNAIEKVIINDKRPTTLNNGFNIPGFAFQSQEPRTESQEVKIIENEETEEYDYMKSRRPIPSTNPFAL